MTTMQTIDADRIEKTISGIRIPPAPDILLDIRREQAKPEPSFNTIAELISRDVALSASILKTINSPFYGLRRKVEAIRQAVTMLGIQNISSLVTAATLKGAVSGCEGLSLERFWQSASDVANISLFLAKKYYFEPSDTFYSLGLFHDCGIPLLAQKYPNYKEVLMKGNNAVDKSIVEVEDAFFNTNHAVLGYYLCTSWHLSPILAEVIMEHHQIDDLFREGANQEHRNQLMGVLKLAGNISHTFRRANDDNEWMLIKDDVLDFFKLDENDYEELKEDIHAMLEG